MQMQNRRNMKCRNGILKSECSVLQSACIQDTWAIYSAYIRVLFVKLKVAWLEESIYAFWVVGLAQKQYGVSNV